MIKKIKYLIPIIAIVFLTAPLPAQAGGIPFVSEVIDAAGHALEGVEEVTLPLAMAVAKLFIYSIIAFLALLVSAALFMTVISDPNWFSIGSGNLMVESGWNFTVGLANMFLILFLVFIAICFILKIETFATKKTLINLIIVALLLNFSLLFVRIIVDIPVFVFNTLDTAAGGNVSDLIATVVGPFSAALYLILTLFGLFVAALALSFWIPVVNVFAQLIFVFIFPALIPLLAIIGLFVFAAFLLTSIFFGYVFLFGVRMVILTIFAILAPLAFLCLIFPQTKKYWNMWLKTVVQWSFLGVVLLFFLVLGFKGFDYFTPKEFAAMTAPKGDPGIVARVMDSLKGWFMYYFFLFIYLLFLAGITKKMMPIWADAIIAGAKQGGRMIWGTAIAPIGKASLKGAERGAVALKEREEAMKRKKGEAYKPSLGMRAGKRMAGLVRRGYHIAGTTPEVQVAKDIEAIAKSRKEKFGKNVGAALDASPPRRLMSPEAKAAEALYLTEVKGGEGLEKLEEKHGREAVIEAVEHAVTFVPHRVEDLAAHDPTLIDDKRIGLRVQNAMVSKGLQKDKKDKTGKTYQDKDVRRLSELGIADANLIREAAFDKAAKALKEADAGTLNTDALRIPEYQRAIIRSRTGRFIQKLGEENQEYADLINQEFQNMTLEEAIKANAELVRQTVTNYAMKAIFPIHHELAKLKTAREQLYAIEKIKEDIAKKRKTTGSTTGSTGKNDEEEDIDY